MMQSFSSRSPRYAFPTISQAFKKRTSAISRTTDRKLAVDPKGGLEDEKKQEPYFVSVFMPSSPSRSCTKTPPLTARFPTFLKNEEQEAICSFSSGHLTGEFTCNFNHNQLIHEFNNSLVAKLRRKRKIDEDSLELVKRVLIENESCIQKLQREYFEIKQERKNLQETLQRIQSLCNIYY